MIPLTTEQNTARVGNGCERSVLKRPVLKRPTKKPVRKPVSKLVQKRRTLSSLIPEGRLSEVEGHGATSAIVRLVAEAQSQGEPVAWITGSTSSVHPPDLAAGGIHLHSLAFLRIVDDAKQTTRLRAAELVLRSGAFALVVIEAPPAHDLPARALSRLHAMARRYNTRVVFRRCHHSKVSLGPLIGLKIHVAREILSGQGERLFFRVQKNKAGQELTSDTEMRFGLQMPDGIDPSQVESAPRTTLHTTLHTTSHTSRATPRATSRATSEGADVIPFVVKQSTPQQSAPSNNPAQGDLFEAFRYEGTLGSLPKAQLTR